MKKHGIRKSGLLITSTIVRETIESLSALLNNHKWLISGNIAAQIWAYYLAGNIVFCRPTDNIDIIGVDIMDTIENKFGVISSGFSGDDKRELNFYVSYNPKFRVHVLSYSSPLYIDGFERVKRLRIWNVDLPVASMEDLIVRKILVSRIEDEIDIINMLRAYQKYLRSVLVKNEEENASFLLSFKMIENIINNDFEEYSDELKERFFEITKANLDELVEHEKDIRYLIKAIIV